jgi:hypothetical protein
MSKLIFGIFRREIGIWLHYIPLEAIIVGFMIYAMRVNILAPLPFIPIPYPTLLNLVWLYLVIAVGDQLIHAILKVD